MKNVASTPSSWRILRTLSVPPFGEGPSSFIRNLNHLKIKYENFLNMQKVKGNLPNVKANKPGLLHSLIPGHPSINPFE